MLPIIITALTFYAVTAAGAGVAFYLLYGIGLNGMLKSCGYKKPWHAFVPFYRVFALGCLSDVYDDARPAQKNRGKILLWLSIAAISLQAVYVVAYLTHAVPIFEVYLPRLEAFMMEGAIVDETTIMELCYEIMNQLAVLPPWLDTLSLFSSAAEIVYFVFTCIALNKVFKIFAPERSGVYLILSILFVPARSIIFFILRKRVPQNLRWQTSQYDSSEYNNTYY